ncbi:MAG: hypothetical protein CM1200mP39_29750 [Dehalococcoidia bacterium]|nr:MAG: hypothetical protein CM1200mP39_29750 [Dehalococcoidia bacterium]
MAKEFGPNGITVNAISPGPIRPEHDDPVQSQHLFGQVGRIPLGHPGEPYHIASLCAYLVSDGGGFVSGQMIACNGAAGKLKLSVSVNFELEMVANKIAILSPGDMGHAVGRVLSEHGFDILTHLEGRSERTRVLAQDAGFRISPFAE